MWTESSNYGIAFSIRSILNLFHHCVMDDSTKTAIKWLLQTTKIGAGVAATVITGGAGGDTAIDMLTVALDTADLTVDMADRQNRALLDFLNLDFKKGPPSIEKRIDQLRRQGAFTPQIIDQLQKLYIRVSAVFAAWISVFVPDDAGATGIFVNEILNAATPLTYDVLCGLFYLMPPAHREMFTNPARLEESLHLIIGVLRKAIKPKTGLFTGFSSPMALAALVLPDPTKLVTNRIEQMIDEQLEPSVMSIVHTFAQVVPLVFAVLYLKKIGETGQTIRLTGAHVRLFSRF